MLDPTLEKKKRPVIQFREPIWQTTVGYAECFVFLRKVVKRKTPCPSVQEAYLADDCGLRGIFFCVSLFFVFFEISSKKKRICFRWESNVGPLVLKATALATEPHSDEH